MVDNHLKLRVTSRPHICHRVMLSMQHGEVVEVGRHAELLERQGAYCDMWSRQQEAATGDGAGSAATSRAASRVASTADLQSSAEAASSRSAAKAAKPADE